MSQYEKSLNILELPAVLRQLAAEAVSTVAKERIALLRPSDIAYEVKRRLGETTAARDMSVLRGSPPLVGIKDVRSALSRADLGGILNTRELLDIAQVLAVARQTMNYGQGDGRGVKTAVSHYFGSLRGNRYLEERIKSSISGEDELSDSASSELADIRRKMRAASSRVREALQKIISSPTYAKALQDSIITMRSDRYVVPVKAEYKSSIPGLVHDVSASGATLFVEPMAAVKANNELRELRAKEKAEIERILAELSAECAAHATDIVSDFELLVGIDIVFAKANLSYKHRAMEPRLTERDIVLRKARHPLLPTDTAVPIDVELGGDYDTLIITGPNTGGKTVSIKTVGLLCAMAACGLHIPAADDSAVPVLKAVLADIGDEQSIEQSLSTFSSHMTNIVRMLDECDEGTLVLFDELGAGTDPVEGAALAIAIIEHVRSRGALVAATTHYSELKVYATTEKGLINASCEFDVGSLRPTYRLLMGIPGKSNAFAISERLGLPNEVIDYARTRVGADNVGFEESVIKLEELRSKLERDYEAVSVRLREAEENRQESENIRRDLERRLEKAGEEGRREAARVLSEARDTMEDMFREIDAMRSRAKVESDHVLENESRAELRRRMNEAEGKFSERTEELKAEKRKSSRAAVVGDVVDIISVGVRGTVDSVERDGSLVLSVGSMKMKAKQDGVIVVENAPKAKESVTYTAPLRTESVSAELDIRGMETLEAIPVMERYLDSAQLASVETVTIIHGKGTGALRKAVQQSLKGNRAVKTHRPGMFGEGEDGVTIVKLK